MLDLDAPVGEIKVEEETLSIEEFAALTDQIDSIRKKIEKGEQPTLEESRLIVVWFRARRKKNFSVIKEKPVKPVKEKAPKTGRTRKEKIVLSPEEQKKHLDNILANF